MGCGCLIPKEESVINIPSNSVTVNFAVNKERSKITIPSNSVIIGSPLISTPPTLLAWCSWEKNKISIIDLETKQNYVTFDGAKISDTGGGWTHIKEIPNSKLLVSLHHNYDKSANMEIFNISKKGRANKIYSLREVSGSKLVVGVGDVTYNSRRSILGAIPVAGRIAYQLFTIDTSALNADGIVKLNRKSKWPPQYSTQTDGFGRCRWSSETGEPFLFVKYDWKILNILDVEKKALILGNPVELEKSGMTYWIDVCQSNGNLLASGGQDEIIKIFDKRESKIVKTFENFHSNFINRVRWNPSGDMIASASNDNTAKVLDFKNGKVIYAGFNSDENWAMSVCFI